MSGSVGLIATIAVHVVVLAFVLAGPIQHEAQPAPISARVISDKPAEQARPEPVRTNPVLAKPQLHMALPEIELVDNAPGPNATVATSSAPPAQAAPQAPVVDSLPQFDADYLDNPSPRYPPLSRRLREQGVVLVRVYVLPNGRPDVVELKRSSGSMRLDESALCAVREWKFVPAQSGGRAVAAWVVVPIAFSLTT